MVDKLEDFSTMSNKIVDVMSIVSLNETLVKLLLNNETDPYNSPFPTDYREGDIIKQSSKYCKISPTPFNPEAEDEDGSMIRVYYNNADFNDNETIMEADIFIDIIVAKKIWLINNRKINKSFVRPYEIANIIINTLGRDSIHNPPPLKFKGFNHLHINTMFDSIRIYAEDFSVER